MTTPGYNVKRWSWLRDLILPVGQVAMESVWLYAVFAVVAALAPIPIDFSYALLAGLATAAVLLAAGSARSPIRFPLNRLLLLPAGVILIVLWLHLAIAPDAPWNVTATWTVATAPWKLGVEVSGAFITLAWVVALFVVGRGLLVGTLPQTPTTVSRWFVGGVGVLVTLFAVTAGGSVPAARLPTIELRNLVLVYFIAGLALTALVHRQSVQSRAAVRSRLSFGWIVAIFVPVALVIAAGAAISGGRHTVRSVMSATVSLLGLLYQLGVWIAAFLWQAVLWLWYWVALLYHWLLSVLPSGSTRSESGAGPVWVPKPPPALHVEQTRLVVPTTDIVPIVAIVLSIVLLALFLRILLKARTRRETTAVVEESESIWSWALLREQVSALWRALGSSLASRRALLLDRLGRRRVAPDTALALDAREIYRAFLMWAARRGQTRSPATTPFEFADQLSPIIAVGETRIDQVTACYVRARYGAVNVPDEELARTRRFVGELQSEHRAAESDRSALRKRFG